MLINKTYVEAIKARPELSSMSEAFFSALRADTHLTGVQKEMILRTWKPNDVRFRDDFINLRENEFQKAFDNKISALLEFQSEGKIRMRIGDEAIENNYNHPVKTRGDVIELKYTQIRADSDEYDLMYMVSNGNYEVGMIYVKD